MNACSRRSFFKLLGYGAAAAALARFAWAESASVAKPNIILINVDDLGWTDLGCYGSKYYETPHIDRLAAEGMRFTDAYAAAAVCSPTRAAIMTGRYPARLGLTDWIRAGYQGGTIPADRRNPTGYESTPNRRLETPRNPVWLEADEITIAELLRAAGYATGHVGKWHLGPPPWDPTGQGFDENHGGCDRGEPPSFFDPYQRPANPKWKEPALDGIPTLPARKPGEYLTDREADEAVAFIRKHKDRPFFLNLWHYAVHTPIQGRPDLVEKYEAKPATTPQKNAKYAAMVESVDQALGQILKTLDELKLTERTVIIFTSDNGGLPGPTSNVPLRAGKGMPYEGGIRVPLIVRWPGEIKPATTTDVPVSSIDLFPTIAAIAEAKLPADRPIDGVNLWPVLRQSGSLQRDALFWHYPHYRSDKVGPYSVVRQGDWKLIRHYDPDRRELFNLKTDLAETTDLAGQYPDKVRELESRLDRWLQDTGAKLPRPVEAKPTLTKE